MHVAPIVVEPNGVTEVEFHHLRGWAEFMDKAMIVSLVVAALAAAAVGVTTWLSIKFNGEVRAVENANFEKFRVASEGRAALLEKDAALARERSAELEKGIAEANARSAQARLALEQFKAPRSLTDIQRSKLISGLAPLVPALDRKLSVSSTAESEPRQYAGQFMEVFRALGINLVNRAEGLDPHNDVYELRPGPDELLVLFAEDPFESLAVQLKTALEAAGLKVRVGRLDRLQFGKVYLTVLNKR